jgi:signal transduction histidine kinase
MMSGGAVDLSKDSAVVGVSIFELPGIMDLPGVQEIAQKLLDGETILNFTRPIETTEGKQLYIQASATPLYDLEGKQLGAILIYSDVTEKKRLEDQLIQSQKMEAVGTLAGGVAHNFNNILVGIMGYSEFLLSQKKENDPDYKALTIIHEGTIRASELTRQLLDVGRRGKYEETEVNLNDLVQWILPLIGGTFQKSIEVKTLLAKNLMIIQGNRDQLEQSLLNLCINARDAMPDGGLLTIETYNQRLDEEFVKSHMGVHTGDHVVLSVTDTGVGMSGEVKARIFEPFFSTKDNIGGTGMGLSTVYGIVKNHGGVITLYSEEGEGTTFKLYFPSLRKKSKSTSLQREFKGFKV